MLAAAVATVAVAAVLSPFASAQAAPPTGVRVDLRVLIVSQGDVTTDAIASQLRTEGVPYDTVDLNDPNRPTITPQFLADTVGGVTRAKYQAIVLPNAAPFTDWSEYDAVVNYERQYGIRQVDAFVWPSYLVGMQTTTYGGSLDGIEATATAAARAGAFSYLRGPIAFEDITSAYWESYGYLPAAQADGTDAYGTTHLEPLVTAPIPGGGGTGVLVGEYTGDGREQLALTFVYNPQQWQARLLLPGIVDWMTEGVHLGEYRNYFSLHIDDVFEADARWSTAGNCTPGDDCVGSYTTTDIRMTAADVAEAVQWQSNNNFTFDMYFNANGSVEYIADHGSDPLTTALLANKSHFRWANHTWSHAFLGCEQDFTVVPWRCVTDPATGDPVYASQAQIEGEISQNLAWAATNGLTVDPDELVTGEHSGMRVLPQQTADNPHLAPALTATGIEWLGADNSRDHDQRGVGSALTVPRHPLNLFYNVATAAEEVDEYNWIYTSQANGGSGICETNPATTCITPLTSANDYNNYIVPTETRIALTHVLANDPRPHYIHQSNLAGDRLAYPLLERLLGTYRAAFASNTPIVCEPLKANGEVLGRQAAWTAALANGTVTAYLLNGVVTIEAPNGLDVPLTAPTGSQSGGTAFGQAYGGTRSAWVHSDGTPLTVTLPS
ncbi:hypothetical protein [Luedemannella flava]